SSVCVAREDEAPLPTRSPRSSASYKLEKLHDKTTTYGDTMNEEAYGTGYLPSPRRLHGASGRRGEPRRAGPAALSPLLLWQPAIRSCHSQEFYFIELERKKKKQVIFLPQQLPPTGAGLHSGGGGSGGISHW